MEGMAFCPAHITGFFKAHMPDKQGYGITEKTGSTGAGFSIKHGVTTKVIVKKKASSNQKQNFRIKTQGYQSDKTDVSEGVLSEFLKLGDFSDLFFDIEHDVLIPIGYGLGSSSATALSLAFALDRALRTKLERTKIGEIAHNAEVRCRTGLGDVLASFHGGFEIRLRPGAPGVGRVEKISVEKISAVMICFSPISTNKFIKENLSQINGLGGKMVNRLLESRSYKDFQDMSIEFARYVDIMTPRMKKLVGEFERNNIKCGVALFGETIFSLVPRKEEYRVLEIMQKYPDGIIIKSELDETGARVLNN